ncbi:MAG: ABC transporter substrate-binding protein [Motiliproteus sp.]|nr:ABC transporter substrate-binding protein [Motiliproteus sp.]MCW9051907.1 ABC transporter substrate-binding protein [Motiliproteus sp.]
MFLTKGFAALRMVMLGLLMLAPLAQASTTEPKAVIEERYQSFLSLIESKTLVAGMPEEELIALMEQELSPVIDFPRVARKVMGKFARRASPEQLNQFTDIFKRTLVTTYAKGLDQLDQLEGVDIKDAVLDKNKRRAKVDSQIVLKGGQQYKVIYSLFLNKDKQQWFIENIIVEGVNIGIVFRNQFAHYMEQNNQDIDKVIGSWGQ